MGVQRGALAGDGVDSGGVGVLASELEVAGKFSKVDSPSVVSSWLIGTSAEKLQVTLITQTAIIGSR